MGAPAGAVDTSSLRKSPSSSPVSSFRRHVSAGKGSLPLNPVKTHAISHVRGTQCASAATCAKARRVLRATASADPFSGAQRDPGASAAVCMFLVCNRQK